MKVKFAGAPEKMNPISVFRVCQCGELLFLMVFFERT